MKKTNVATHKRAQTTEEVTIDYHFLNAIPIKI